MYTLKNRVMDKFGWQRPYLEPSKTGIEQAAAARRMRARGEKVSMIAEGNVIAKQQEEMMSKIK